MLVRCGNDSQLSPLTLLCNQGARAVFSNVRENLTKGYKKFVELKPNGRISMLAGSGPSLADSLENIRAMQKRGAFLIAMNGTARYLSDNGIKPDVIAMVDSRPENKGFLEEAWAPQAWLASQCDPSVFEQAEKVGMEVTLWHPGIPGIQPHIPSADTMRMGGGYTVGLCAISCAYVAGYRELHLFGYDSSHREDKGHAFDQPMNAGDETVTAVVDSRKFISSVVMAGQASLFLEFTDHLLKDGVELHVHGEGLLPTLWRVKRREKQIRILSAVYDLGVSPPTFDFISFLVEAERTRLEKNYDALDVVFQPGPMHGFRNDDLPPDIATRSGMLWRVCAGIARLLPSVRNVHVLSERRKIGGDVFPDGWDDDKPISHYGTIHLRGGVELLKASEYAKAWAKKFKKPYATITLRQSSYWSERNSKIKEWLTVASWLVENGVNPVFVPDTELPHLGQWPICQEAAFDVDLRAALYEGAVINLGVANGPMFLLPFLKARYLIFNIGDGSTPATSTEFLLSHGVAKGDETVFGGNGKVIWKPDTAENILAELSEFDSQQQRKTL